MANKSALKEILYDLSSPEELKQLRELENEKKVAAIETSMNELKQSVSEDQTPETLQSLRAELQRFKQGQAQYAEEMGTAMKEMQSEFIKSMTTIRESLELHAPDKLTVPLYKGMIDNISKVEKAITDKPVPVWRWPQYASVSVRDRNFANINPSIAPFNITSPYDYIQLAYTGSNLTTATYKSGGASGSTVASLILAYDGSNNLTSVTRTA